MTARDTYATVTEKEWQRQVVDLLGWNGWASYHTYDSRRSNPGFPDIFAIHIETGDRLAAELKTEEGRVSPAQEWWLNLFELAGIDCYVWRPSDVDKVIARAQKPGS